MRRWKKGALFLILMLSISLVLVGCNNSSKSDDKGKEETFPTKPINLIIPFGAGGGTDQVGRMVAGIIEKELGQPVVSVNKVGAGSAVGLTDLKNSKNDGYTILLSASNISTLKVTGTADLTYEDFEPIIGVNFDAPGLLVQSSAPWQTAEEFIAYAKENTVQVGTGSPGGLWHLGALKLQKETDTKFNIIPSTTGGASASVTLMGGHVDAIVIPPNEAIAQLKSGDFRMLATLTPERIASFPDVPTFYELGYDGVEILSLRGFLAPKGTPQELIKTLHDHIKDSLKDERFVKYMDEQVSNIHYLSTEEYKDYLKNEQEVYSQLMKDAGLAAQ